MIGVVTLCDIMLYWYLGGLFLPEVKYCFVVTGYEMICVFRLPKGVKTFIRVICAIEFFFIFGKTIRRTCNFRIMSILFQIVNFQNILYIIFPEIEARRFYF